MNERPRTVGELVASRGMALLMIKFIGLAVARRRVPVRVWIYRFVTDPRLELVANGGPSAYVTAGGLVVPRFDVAVFYDGWPAGTFNAAGGSLVRGLISEAALLEAFDREQAAAELEAAAAGPAVG